MNTNQIIRLILTTLFILVMATRKYFEQKAARIVKDGTEQDKDSSAMIKLQSLLLALSNLGMIVYLINPSWMSWSTSILHEWSRWLGVVLGIAGTALLMWTHILLGNSFFGGMKTRSGHELIKIGPYRLVRHPMYTAFITIGLAWYLLYGSWFIAGLWLTATALVIATRLTEEEKMMLQQFGDEYSLYQQQTGRFLPKI